MQQHIYTPGLARAETWFPLNNGPFAPVRRFWTVFLNALLATALFRFLHITLFFTAWGTCVTLINHQKIYQFNFQPTLLTVIGTVIGFVISYRTSSSVKRYDEGRQLWSQIIFQSRKFARAVWFHVPDIPAATPGDEGRSAEELNARNLVEKKTVINLIEGFAVAVKHYLRGEEGVYYEDLWPLVKCLPTYALPVAFPSSSVTDNEQETSIKSPVSRKPASVSHLPLHNPPSVEKRSPNIIDPPYPAAASHERAPRSSLVPPGAPRSSIQPLEDPALLPSRLPPALSYFDIFPFSLLVTRLTRRGKMVKGRTAARLRARLGHKKRGSYNVPLEITLYLSSYIAALQRRQAIDAPTTDLLLSSLNGLLGALTGLERVSASPMPFSYSIYLWTVTAIYCLALPLQIWKTMGWLTIPATSILSFIFFGFLVVGKEVGSPFGYDRGDIDMDHFTYSIIHTELMAITSLPMSDPTDWVFSSLNDVVFDTHNLQTKMRAGS